MLALAVAACCQFPSSLVGRGERDDPSWVQERTRIEESSDAWRVAARTLFHALATSCRLPDVEARIQNEANTYWNLRSDHERLTQRYEEGECDEDGTCDVSEEDFIDSRTALSTTHAELEDALNQWETPCRRALNVPENYDQGTPLQKRFEDYIDALMSVPTP